MTTLLNTKFNTNILSSEEVSSGFIHKNEHGASDVVSDVGDIHLDGDIHLNGELKINGMSITDIIQ